LLNRFNLSNKIKYLIYLQQENIKLVFKYYNRLVMLLASATDFNVTKKLIKKIKDCKII